LIELNMFDTIRQKYDIYGPTDLAGNPVPLFLLGEVFGPGVQDLTYGQDRPTFRLFAVVTGYSDSLKYMDAEDLEVAGFLFQVPVVPFVASNVPFSYDLVNSLTAGTTTMGGDQIREGIVIVPARERYDNGVGGRLALKSISESYLLRKNKNATEYQ
jgi:RNA ligase (TIGR02306 family)